VLGAAEEGEIKWGGGGHERRSMAGMP
jgi:hypothetical protein